MPAEYFHVSCARDALDSIGGVWFPLEDDCFDLGCQGPDVFSHNRRTRPLALAYARLLHRRAYGAFSADFASGFASLDAKAKSWFLGFLTHAAVDRAVHPYIISKSNPLAEELPAGIDRAQLHAFFERILDDAFEGYRMENLGALARYSPVRVPIGLSAALAPQLARSLSATYGDKAGDRVEERVMNAFSDAERVYALTSPHVLDSGVCPAELARLVGYGPQAVALLRPSGLREAEDWLNLQNAPWLDPVTGKARRESAMELGGIGIERAAETLRAAVRVCSGDAPVLDLERAVGNDCLSLCGADGLPVPVRHSSPFDLVSALLAQTKLRQAQVGGREGSVDRPTGG